MYSVVPFSAVQHEFIFYSKCLKKLLEGFKQGGDIHSFIHSFTFLKDHSGCRMGKKLPGEI